MTDARDPLSTDALDVVVQLLFELGDEGDQPWLFYDRICEAVCRLTSMERAVLFLYDEERKLVLPAGSHGVEHEILAHAYGTLEETPIARRALREDRVLETSDLASEIPSRYATTPGIVKLTCTPVAAAGRWLGVIFAECDGRDFELSENERRTMRAMGRTAALATHVRQATAQRERERMLLSRVELARDVHERVMQRLFGISMVLGTGGHLSLDDRERAAAEIESALGELRDALARSIEPTAEPSRTTLRAELERLGRQYKHLPLQVSWEEGAEVPQGLEPLAVSVLTEALRNAEKHARPSAVQVAVGRSDDAFALEVRNDGLRRSRRFRRGRSLGAGLGLRLAAYESLQRGGMLEFGTEGEEWRVRLVLPSGGNGAAGGGSGEPRE
jgi:signal transduction histidine kinase